MNKMDSTNSNWAFFFSGKADAAGKHVFIDKQYELDDKNTLRQMKNFGLK